MPLWHRRWVVTFAATVQHELQTRWALAGVVGLLLWSAPPDALAGTAEVVDIPGCVPSELNQGCKYETAIAARYVHYEAGMSEGNVATLTALGKTATGDEQFRISDAGAPVVADAGCESVNVSTALCTRRRQPPSSPNMPQVNLGDLDDSLVLGPKTFVSADGGPGADVMRAGDAGAWLGGGPGDDVILGGQGLDSLGGGEGDDSVAGAGGNDNIGGGPGRDVVDGGSGDDRLVGSDETADAVGDQLEGGEGEDLVEYGSPEENQWVRVDLRRGLGGGGSGRATDRLRSIENARGTAGPDALIGDARANRLDGYLGDDRVEAGDGDDEVVKAERVRCGSGMDSVASPSSRFTLPRECEIVKPYGFGPELVIRTYPLGLSDGRLSFQIPCIARGQRPCIVRVTLHALSSARAGNVRERLGTSGPVAVRPGTSRSIVVSLTAGARSRLERARTPLRVRIAQGRLRSHAYAISLGG